MRKSYKTLYIAKEVEVFNLKDDIKALEEAIAGLEKDCDDYEEIINELNMQLKKEKENNKFLDAHIKKLMDIIGKLEEEVKPEYLREG